MRRSQMVKYIEWIIDDNGYQPSDFLADLILDTIEEKGMLPPLREVVAHSHLFLASEFEWEKE